MPTYLALLRGINVGGNNTVSMKALKALFESLGFANVRTYINSGNVIFSSTTSPSSTKIETALKKEFGFELNIVIRDNKSIEQIVQTVPKKWQNNSDEKTDVLFLWDQFDSKQTLKDLKFDTKYISALYIQGAIVYHLKKKNYNKSKINDLIKAPVYKHMTARNINTVRKLNSLMNPFSLLAKPAQRALAKAEITTLADLSSWNQADLQALHGIGKNALTDIQTMMKKSRISFKKS